MLAVRGLSRLWVIAGLALVLLVAGAAVYLFYPQNLARRPPELDQLRRDILKSTHLEADLEVDQSTLGEPVLDGKVRVVFAHVPPMADKAEIEKEVRRMVKEALPHAKELDVRFGDNLRTQPLDREEPDEAFGGPKRSH